MESEFIALDKAGDEAEWLQNFFKDIPYWPKPVAPVCIHCDSQAAIGRAGSMMYNGKSHHIRRKHNTVRKFLSSGIITVDYVKSKDNMSDSLIKGLSTEGVERTSKEMGLRPRTNQHSGEEEKHFSEGIIRCTMQLVEESRHERKEEQNMARDMRRDMDVDVKTFTTRLMMSMMRMIITLKGEVAAIKGNFMKYWLVSDKIPPMWSLSQISPSLKFTRRNGWLTS
ncbi:hypothetical protein CQW23_26118 [Capsicum baccatum]|uniref:Uncharacterized protein n=1 Tax=Capsicum baccatum TaxID=33114 RepID=A0A2G2VMX1_CAPBA|nr:hypothetical protein CQW23_26118 [Capsicum baccatum]